MSRTLLHPGTVLDERVRPPLLVGAGAFKALWVGVAALVSLLLLLATAVAGRVS